LSNDTLISGNHHYRVDGKGIDTSFSLKPLAAYQEFWHSWRTFNPATKNIKRLGIVNLRQAGTASTSLFLLYL
jgi:hypothetical protein